MCIVLKESYQQLSTCYQQSYPHWSRLAFWSETAFSCFINIENVFTKSIVGIIGNKKAGENLYYSRGTSSTNFHSNCAQAC
jgi:hypothetical protein